ncbi:hypothetical protein [Halomonas citrativorans]|uniref:hypothetical protein n=1 Tax=Halomonas citrativorans TaxID=2742612 RepID=UPI000B354380|nr:hypothetical protein [Halomonas citrativorans]
MAPPHQALVHKERQRLAVYCRGRWVWQQFWFITDLTVRGKQVLSDAGIKPALLSPNAALAVSNTLTATLNVPIVLFTLSLLATQRCGRRFVHRPDR